MEIIIGIFSFVLSIVSLEVSIYVAKVNNAKYKDCEIIIDELSKRIKELEEK